MTKSKQHSKSSFLGDFKEKNLVSHRFIEAFNKMKQKGIFDTYEDFCAPYGYTRQTMAKIAAGTHEAPAILLWAMVEEYGVDANFFFNDKLPLDIKKTFK